MNLTMAVNEMDIGYHYRQFFTRKIPGLNITSPYKCDGFAVHEKLRIRLLFEFKKEGANLDTRIGLATVLIQAIYYIKKFELDGIILPSTIFLGDRNNFTILHTNDIISYLAMPLDWSTAPSSAAVSNPDVVKMIKDDERINPFIFSSNQLDDSVDKIKNLTQNVTRLIPMKNVLTKNNLSTNELANLFVQILVNPVENYLHPLSKINSIVTKNFGQVSAKSREKFKSFFEHFKSDYTPKEKEVLTSILDRLIEDIIRRKQGEFFTPTEWVNKCHEYISSVFGEDWKEKYVVWDPAWGTGNLTRDYKFKELYCSTLNQSDIDTANQMGFNREAVKFQYDFLNDDYSSLPQGLRKSIEEGKKIIILMNPPYAAANDGANKGATKSGLTLTKIGNDMRNSDMGKSTQQIYNQFFFRIIKEFKCHICVFSPPLFLTGPSSIKIRNLILIDNILISKKVITFKGS